MIRKTNVTIIDFDLMIDLLMGPICCTNDGSSLGFLRSYKIFIHNFLPNEIALQDRDEDLTDSRDLVTEFTSFMCMLGRINYPRVSGRLQSGKICNDTIRNRSSFKITHQRGMIGQGNLRNLRIGNVISRA